MDVVRALEGAARGAGGRPLPLPWRLDERFEGLATIEEMISIVRDLGDESDRVLGALVERGPLDQSASVVVLAALLRLGLARCRGNRERVDAFAAELAVVLGEAWAGEMPVSRRRLGSVMVDRAWGRVRAAERKGRWLHPVDLDQVADTIAGHVPSPEDTVVTRVAVEEIRRALGSASDDDSAGTAMVVRAWDTAVRLVDQAERSQRERNQWRYARTVLRQRVSPDLELLADVM